ncbi:glycoside hydrolase family 35 protein [Macrolepiota fuliginosa MF-IS2]|uniref:beta-galactosidase n=1 Tax=Macrolepiota fuliginosa MF-IS2 TaxID=1400762 RepID=A0A9P5XJ48_9AGAR|nr:glycoside hydrolase family 35 protein [Macrolepiota fuliginosa MF-IS2]
MVSARTLHSVIRNSETRTDDVRFDNYTLILKGRRTFIYSGEFHTFRLPVPSLWPDILQKAKAAGLNCISVYTHMGLINPAPGVVDFNGFRALQPLFDEAKAAGLWVILRPGPYINAETTAGGIAHWATTEVAGTLRTNDTDWKAAWQGYIQGIINVTAPNQISNGGPVIAVQIDNEYQQTPISHAEYFADLEAAYHDSPIVVPLTYNDPGQRRNFINGTGAVDIYGLDAYPQHFDCSTPTVWVPITANDHQYHADVNPSQPFYYPEFQAGASDAWGPTSLGYDACRILTGPDFQSVFNLQVWASNGKLVNFYMFYGGTSWGSIPVHDEYTSYDYGASIRESRELSSKFDEAKRQALFLRSSRDFYKTDWIADTSTGLSVSTNPAAFITLLKNPDTGAQFYIARQNDSASATVFTTFKLNVSTSAGALQIPTIATAITLNGRESKVIVTDYSFGSSSKVVYSTASIFFAGTIDKRDILFLYGNSTQEHEVGLELTGTPTKISQPTSPKIRVTQGSSLTTFTVLAGLEAFTTLYDSDTQLILYADSATVATFWAPLVAGAASDPFRNYWDIGTNQTILVGGPYLVRNASLDSTGQQLALAGDLKEGVRLTVIGPRTVRQVTWNGNRVAPDTSIIAPSTVGGTFVGQLGLHNDITGIKIPKLTGWKFQDTLPEVNDANFDDSSWTLANKTTTNIPLKPYYGDGRILYGCDYGFCEGVVLWRGHFQSTGQEKSMNLSINGGEAFAASVWLNNVFLNTSFGNSTHARNIREETDDKFIIPVDALRSGDNIVTVAQDNMGLNETTNLDPNSSKSPRGIRGFKLEGGTFGDWKVQGKVGGYLGFLDKTRGILNEGGLFGERKGWHLPGFSTAGWQKRDLSQGLPGQKAGIGFFITTFNLNIPRDVDAMLSFNFEEPLGQPYRAYMFVNGWMMGKRIANLGPQAKFPVHEGILNYRGSNTVAVALWAMTPDVPITPNLQLRLDGVYEGGVGNVQVDNPVWSPQGRE